MQYSTVQYSTVQYSTVQFSTLYHTTLYYIAISVWCKSSCCGRPYVRTVSNKQDSVILNIAAVRSIINSFRIFGIDNMVVIIEKITERDGSEKKQCVEKKSESQ